MAQTNVDTNRDASPKYGISLLAANFETIQFTEQQLAKLSKSELELVMRIDREGIATLLKVNGVRDAGIIDSLSRKFSRISPNFNPRIENGMSVNSIYSLMLHIPRAKPFDEERNEPLGRYGEPGFVKSYNKSGKRLDFLIGLMANGYSCNAREYQQPGGGMKLDVIYSGPNFGAGMVIALVANELKKDYPIVTNRERSKLPTTFMIGLALNRVMHEWKRSEFIMQFELNYAEETITPQLYSNDYDNVKFTGWSPGFVGNYLIRIGKDKFGSESMRVGKREPVVYYSYLNFHAALRPLYFNSKEASGLMFEVGVSYRFSAQFLKGYVIK